MTITQHNNFYFNTPIKHDDPPEVVDEKAKMTPRGIAGIAGTQELTKVDIRFTVADVLKAFELLDKERINPCIPDVGCSYIERNTQGHVTGTLPSCLVGTIIALLNPGYFAEISEASCTADELPGVGERFREDAVQLLYLAQKLADKASPDQVRPQETWGRAMILAHKGLRA